MKDVDSSRAGPERREGVRRAAGLAPVRSAVMGRMALLAFGLLLSWVALELCLNLFYWLYPPELDRFLIGDRFEQALRFDPIRGRYYTPTPNRVAYYDHGILEYLAVQQGNSLGFPDRDEFGPRRDLPEARRVAVFGDSFTAASYLQKNWPEQVEELVPDAPLQLLNFSLDGGGLANWWSVLTRFVGPQQYELDGVIFAVYPGDLRRKFAFGEGRGNRFVLGGSASSWDPATWPATEEAARQQMVPNRVMYKISPAEFDAAMRTGWQPPVERRLGLKLPVAVQQMLPYLRAKYMEGRAHLGMDRFRGFDPGREKLIGEMGELLRQRKTPVLVVFVPSRTHLLGSWQHREALEETRAFAAALGAEFVDGSRAFQELTEEEIRAHWLRYDAHWNQRGSDRFAAFMAQVLRPWPAEVQ
jgi:hypothetical protein